MEVADLLNDLGLSKTESKVYLAALELGKSLPKHLAEKAVIKRPTLYEALPKLLEHGLLAETVIGKRRYLVPEDPQIFLDKKQASLNQVEAMVPQLRALLATSLEKPQIIFYEGVEGLKKTFQDTLRQRQPILEFVGVKTMRPEFEKYLKNYYVTYRVKYNIPLKMLISGPSQSGIWNLKNDPAFLREVKTIPKELFPIPLDCNIYGDSISFSLHLTDSEPIGLIIRSKEIATTMKSLFNFIWEKA